MPTPQELEEIKKIEEYRYTVRQEIEAKAIPKKHPLSYLWDVLNSPLFVTVLVGFCLSQYFKIQEDDRAAATAQLETHLKLIEGDRDFLTHMTETVKAEPADRARISKALIAYETAIKAEYAKPLTNFASVNLPGLDATIDIVTVEQKAAAAKVDSVEEHVIRTAARSAKDPADKITVASKVIAQSSFPISAENRDQIKAIVASFDEKKPLTDAQNAELNNVVQVAAAPLSKDASQSVQSIFEAAGPGTTRLFVHIADENQRSVAQAWLKKLPPDVVQQLAFSKVLTYAQIGVKPRDGDTVVRYENADMRDLANEINSQIIKDSPGDKIEDLEYITPQFSSGYPKQIEVWFNQKAKILNAAPTAIAPVGDVVPSPTATQ